jgi:hypothetical protein
MSGAQMLRRGEVFGRFASAGLSIGSLLVAPNFSASLGPTAATATVAGEGVDVEVPQAP